MTRDDIFEQLNTLVQDAVGKYVHNATIEASKSAQESVREAGESTDRETIIETLKEYLDEAKEDENAATGGGAAEEAYADNLEDEVSKVAEDEEDPELKLAM